MLRKARKARSGGGSGVLEGDFACEFGGLEGERAVAEPEGGDHDVDQESW